MIHIFAVPVLAFTVMVLLPEAVFDRRYAYKSPPFVFETTNVGVPVEAVTGDTAAKVVLL